MANPDDEVPATPKHVHTHALSTGYTTKFRQRDERKRANGGEGEEVEVTGLGESDLGQWGFRVRPIQVRPIGLWPIRLVMAEFGRNRIWPKPNLAPKSELGQLWLVTGSGQNKCFLVF